MFKLRNIQLGDEFTDVELSNALMSVVTYTYGDRFMDRGYDIAATPSEGASDSGSISVGPVVIANNPDATLLVTDYASGKMGVISTSAAEAAFVQENPALMQRIATLLGYSDYVIYVLTQLVEGQQSRTAFSSITFDFGTNTGSVTVTGFTRAYDSDPSRGIYHSPDTPAKLYTVLSGATISGMIAPNGLVKWSWAEFQIPLAYYITDMQNVQDAAMKAVKMNAAHSDAQDAAMTQAFSSVAALVGSLSVFGDTVKNVTERYNNITQYIPRP